MVATSHDILLEVRAAGRNRQFVLSVHAVDRAGQRGVQRKDIAFALQSSTRAVAQTDGRWRMEGGKDFDGDELTVVVRLDQGQVVVITVF